MCPVRVGNLLAVVMILTVGLTACTFQAGLGPSHWGAPMRAPAAGPTATVTSTSMTPR